jgi:hypothetical protein
MLTAAAAMAIIDIEPENLLRMMDLPLSCSMLLFAMNSRRLRMVTVFGIGNTIREGGNVEPLYAVRDIARGKIM